MSWYSICNYESFANDKYVERSTNIYYRNNIYDPRIEKCVTHYRIQ